MTKMCSLFQQAFLSLRPFHSYLWSSTLDKGVPGSVSLYALEGQVTACLPAKSFLGKCSQGCRFSLERCA